MGKPNLLLKKTDHYCPGCTHTIIHKVMAEVIEELGIEHKTIAIAPVGCSVMAYEYIDIDWVEVAHGRAPAAASGIKAVHPDKVVISYQGDGDLASIGFNETVHAAARGENITVIFINNGIYGMTGGQMSPTTMLERKTTTSPAGRETTVHGSPLKVCEMLNQIGSPDFIARCHASDKASTIQAKEVIRYALKNQVNGTGYSFVEVLSVCPTNWGLNVKESFDYVKNEVVKEFPLGIFRKNGVVLDKMGSLDEL